MDEGCSGTQRGGALYTDNVLLRLGKGRVYDFRAHGSLEDLKVDMADVESVSQDFESL